MLQEEQIFTPELLPRQGERNAWILAVLASLALFLLNWQGVVPFFSWIFVIFLVVSALSISLGNWMDRHTRLHLSRVGIAFENGLRRADLEWAQINEIRILPARWGEQIHVIGEKAHFSFSTLGELQFQGQNRTKVGFAQGQEILREILKASGLTKKQKNEQYAYYSRA